MEEVFSLLFGTIRLRPYVFFFLACFLGAATADLGWRRAGLFAGLTWVTAFLAEYSSTRTGIPFGLYHYTPVTLRRGHPGAGTLPCERPVHGFPFVHVSRLRGLLPGPPGLLGSPGVAHPPGVLGRHLHDAHRHGHRSPGRPRRPLVSRPDLLLSRRRPLLRRPALELRGLGGRGLDRHRELPDRRGAARYRSGRSPSRGVALRVGLDLLAGRDLVDRRALAALGRTRSLRRAPRRRGSGRRDETRLEDVT